MWTDRNHTIKLYKESLEKLIRARIVPLSSNHQGWERTPEIRRPILAVRGGVWYEQIDRREAQSKILYSE